MLVAQDGVYFRNIQFLLRRKGAGVSTRPNQRAGIWRGDAEQREKMHSNKETQMMVCKANIVVAAIIVAGTSVATLSNGT